jgi:hypothetical protein
LAAVQLKSLVFRDMVPGHWVIGAPNTLGGGGGAVSQNNGKCMWNWKKAKKNEQI